MHTYIVCVYGLFLCVYITDRAELKMRLVAHSSRKRNTTDCYSVRVVVFDVESEFEKGIKGMTDMRISGCFHDVGCMVYCMYTYTYVYTHTYVHMYT